MYDRQSVVDMTRGIPSPVTVQGIGQNESSISAQHAAAIAFWQSALALDGEDAVSPSVREFALEEIARHQAALDGVPFMSAEDKRNAGVAGY